MTEKKVDYDNLESLIQAALYAAQMNAVDLARKTNTKLVLYIDNEIVELSAEEFDALHKQKGAKHVDGT